MNWTLLSIILATVFFVTSITLAFKLAKKKKPVWAYKTTKIIGLGSNAPPELKLTFNAQPVSDVYRTRVILFNKGNETILKENVTESIAIHFEGADILRQPTILAMSRKGIELSAKHVVKNGDNAIGVSFKYLDHNDGVIIEVLHTTSQGIRASGNIIGTSKIRYIGEFAPNADGWSLRGILILGFLIIGAMFAVILKEGKGLRVETIGAYIPVLLALALVFKLGVVPFIRCRRFPRWSVAKS